MKFTEKVSLINRPIANGRLNMLAFIQTKFFDYTTKTKQPSGKNSANIPKASNHTMSSSLLVKDYFLENDIPWMSHDTACGPDDHN